MLAASIAVVSDLRIPAVFACNSASYVAGRRGVPAITIQCQAIAGALKQLRDIEEETLLATSFVSGVLPGIDDIYLT